MIQSSLSQLVTLLWGVLTGAVCGAAASAAKGAREELRPPVAVSMAMDLLLWIFAACAVLWTSLRFGDGGVRGYQLLAAVCGFCLHGLCLSRLTEKGGRLLARLIRLALEPAAFLLRGVRLYIEKIYKSAATAAGRAAGLMRRRAALDRTRKKLQKNYKKML